MSANTRLRTLHLWGYLKAMARSAFKISACILAGALLAFAVQLYLSFKAVAHDKAANADVLQRPREEPGLPFGKVVPPSNRWTSNAFVAERGAGGNAVLILDDHYQGSDPAYRSTDGVIGDKISPALLCSVRAQASANGVIVDSAVLSLINAKCGNES